MIECKIMKFDELGEQSDIEVSYSFQETPFGKCLIGFIENENTQKAVCYLSFTDNNENEILKNLKTKYSDAKFTEEPKKTKELIDDIFYKDTSRNVTPVQVLLKGTEFQMQVWEALTKIPMGTLTTYEKVAKSIDKPKATRAVANALKANQIGYLIPCHRVVCKSGCNKFGWGVQRKVNMQEFEVQYLKNEKPLKE
ncbi:regulatory protein ada [Nasonia vitripennis]|uniref:Methylated-DNA--protein-cysteine methyltransferase n=1 Tax=Nasonia vitripennis TaxID=7425 RepID=A0A7M7R1X7_NASVI|nr:regulatory protein ada [Nasonia vitripennis]